MNTNTAQVMKFLEADEISPAKAPTNIKIKVQLNNKKSLKIAQNPT
jgi:hypothetical protein